MYKEKIQKLLEILTKNNDEEGMQLIFVLFPSINAVITGYGSYLVAQELGKIRFQNELDFEKYIFEKKKGLNLAYEAALGVVKMINRDAKRYNLPLIFQMNGNQEDIIKNEFIPFVKEFFKK